MTRANILPPADGISGRPVGGWIETSVTYASSRYPSSTGLKMTLCRNVGYRRRIPLAALHGFSQTAYGEIESSTFRRWTLRRLADLGFEVFAPELPGTAGSTGTRDAAGPGDTTAVEDALEWVRANVPGVDQRRFVVDGYSGGGGLAYAYACKFPARASYMICNFGMADHGYSDTYGWYQQSAVGRANMDLWIGDHDDPDIVATAYRARNTLESLPGILAYSPVERLYMLHDAQDSTVSVLHSRRMSALLGTIPHSYRETDTPDEIRALHENPHNGTGIARLEPDWITRARNAKPWQLPIYGSMRVLGHAKFLAGGRRWEVWTGPDASPATAESGGLDYVVDFEWDGRDGTWSHTEQNGACEIQVILDGEDVT